MSDPHTVHHSAGHEADDIRARPILLATFWLIIGLLISAGLMWLLLRVSLSYRAGISAPADPLAATHARQQPPQPRLQTEPVEDLQQLRAREDEVLHSYGWIDRDGGVVRIPIERAIELLSSTEGSTGTKP